MNILNIQASLFGANGQSSKLAEGFINDLRERFPAARVTTRDLATEPVPPLDAERFQALITAPEARTEKQQVIVAQSDALIAELRAADVIVFGVPMYNFNIPAALQNWFDHVARSGVTFRYTENGPEGLIKGKRVVAFITRGGQYGESHSQTAYLRQILGFLGMDDLDIIHAEGLAMGDAVREQSLASARGAIAELVVPVAVAA